jgi:tetratricopeptide (TPR) repeat protein
MTLPPLPTYGIPKQDVVVNLLQQLNRHPLSVSILACQLKKDSVAAVNERIAQLLSQLSANISAAEKPLLVSFYLSLHKLEGHLQPWLPRLGVFQGGAFENILQAITEIPDTQWQVLRQSLENTCLIQAEQMDGVTVPYLKFHPSLAPMLWQQLPVPEKQALTKRYRQGYHELASFLYEEDKENPLQAGTIEFKEMPNLLKVLKDALENGEEWVGDLVEQVQSFLSDFGLKLGSDEEESLPEIPKKKTVDPETFQDWYVTQSKQGEQLYAAKHYPEAQTIFQDVLNQMDDKASYERCKALGWVGRCLKMQEQPEASADYYRQKLLELEQLAVSPQVKREMGRAQTELAEVLTETGNHQEARSAYEKALVLVKETGDIRSEAVIQGQLGTLAKSEGNYPVAEQHYQQALRGFQHLKEPKYEAIAWYQLGIVYEQAKQWQGAIQAYQKAAQLEEQQGQLTEAAKTWNRLANLSQQFGQHQQAETYYRKAIEMGKATQDWTNVSKQSKTLAELILQNQPQRLPDARQLAEQALSIEQTMAPEQTQIWETYTLLANIAHKQNALLEAQNYRRLGQEAQIKAQGLENKLPRHQQFIEAVVQTTQNPKLRKQLDAMLQQREAKGWQKLVAATRRILNGERDWEVLSQNENLDLEDALIVQNILHQLQSNDAVITPPQPPSEGILTENQFGQSREQPVQQAGQITLKL